MRRAFQRFTPHHVPYRVADQCRGVAHGELVKPRLANVAHMRHAPGVGARSRMVSHDQGYIRRELFRFVRDLQQALWSVRAHSIAACGIARTTIFFESINIRAWTLTSQADAAFSPNPRDQAVDLAREILD